MPDELTWDEHELLARIAHRWYLDGRTQDAIGREFGLSRPKVQRLLERARATGVVEIHVEPPLGIALDLEGDLVQTFSLTDAIVSSLRADAESQRAGVARQLDAASAGARDRLVVAARRTQLLGAGRTGARRTGRV